MAEPASLVLKRYIAVQLFALRERAGLTRDTVARELGRSVGHVRHLESMRTPVVPAEAEMLLRMYGAADRIADFRQLIDAAKAGTNWWADLPGVPPWLELLLAFETAAVMFRAYDTMTVRGLLQTPAYTELVIRAGQPHLPDDEVRARVELRSRRQDVLTRPNPPTMWNIIDEAVLYRGQQQAPAVLADQLTHLITLSELPNVHIQVLPRTVLTAGMNGTFVVMAFDPKEFVDDPGVAYTESRIRGHYIETEEEIDRFQTTWSDVQEHAHPPEESRSVLARRVEEICRDA